MRRRGSAFILALVTATSFTLIVIIAFTVLARPTNEIFNAFNQSMANFTGQTGEAWQSFNGLNRSFKNMWFPIGAGLVLFAIVYVILHAQRREYVTGQVR